jgi:hypothetical protein
MNCTEGEKNLCIYRFYDRDYQNVHDLLSEVEREYWEMYNYWWREFLGVKGKNYFLRIYVRLPSHFVIVYYSLTMPPECPPDCEWSGIIATDDVSVIERFQSKLEKMTPINVNGILFPLSEVEA